MKRHDFEMVTTSRRSIEVCQGEVVDPPLVQGQSRIGAAIADNFGRILDLASTYLEIETIKVRADAESKRMEDIRKNLLAEAEAYATKKSADTDGVIQKMQMVREMMRDFYQYNNNANLSGEDFSRIISSIVSEMGRL